MFRGTHNKTKAPNFMKLTKSQKQALDEEQTRQDLEDAKYRARGITVGTAFGGTTEVTMRGPGASFLYSLMQPVEVVELIHQLSANIGCHINILPRRDFASWRDWKVSDEELAHAKGLQNLQGVGWPPFVNDMTPHMQIGANLASAEEQPGFIAQNVQEKKHVATKKAVNKRSTKRSRTSTK